MDIAIAIRIGSPESTLKLVRDSIESIQSNIGKCSYRFILSPDPSIPKDIKDYLATKKETNPNNFEIFDEENIYWADFINRAIQSAKDSEYLLIAHDDVILITPNFFPEVKKILTSLKDLPAGYLLYS